MEEAAWLWNSCGACGQMTPNSKLALIHSDQLPDPWMLWEDGVSLIFLLEDFRCHDSNHQTTRFSNQRGTIQTRLRCAICSEKWVALLNTTMFIYPAYPDCGRFAYAICPTLIYVSWNKHVPSHYLAATNNLTLRCMEIKPPLSMKST